MAELNKAVFLSYASQDAEAAQRICAALRSAGVEVWFDQSELRGGDAWDRQIRKQIHDCALFVPVISAHSDARHEGYFRREWRLAVERSGDFAEDVAFLLPVVVDDTADATARVPDRFREVQWSRLSDGQTSPAFVERVQRLLSPAPPSTSSSPASIVPGAAVLTRQPVPQSRLSRRSLLVIGAVIIATSLAYWGVDRFWISKHQASPPVLPADPPAATPAAFSPPPHSIAVLPFVNMSGDPKQDYFSDGLSEELLNSLVAVRDLQVAARTSSFTFKGKNDDVADIARKLHVGAVLEGSVRKDGNQVRITAQLINALSGFHLWSHTYDRDLKNVLKLQTEIATAVTMALQATLLADAATIIEIGGTQNPAAFDAYLRGKNLGRKALNKENTLAMMALFSEAVRLDPTFARAHVEAAEVQIEYAGNFGSASDMTSWVKRARENAEKALALAPELGDAHVAMALILERGYLELRRAQSEYERALALSPNDANVLMRSGRFFVTIGRTDAGLANIRRAIELDQLNPQGYALLSFALTDAKKYHEANEAIERSLQIDANSSGMNNARGLNYLRLGEFDSARRSCEAEQRDWQGRLCMAIVYEKAHRHAEAESERAAFEQEFGAGAAYQLTEIYAQWGNIPKALEWLDAAYHLPDPGIIALRVDSLVDPLRKEPRFQEIERKLNFPN